MLIGAAMYIDLLKAPALLSLCLQDEKLDIVRGIRHLLQSSKHLKSIAGQSPLEWPTVKLICGRIKDDDGENVYQGAVVSNYNPTTLNACADSALADINQLDNQMQGADPGFWRGGFL